MDGCKLLDPVAAKHEEGSARADPFFYFKKTGFMFSRFMKRLFYF